jgi:hypothetical protein
MVKKTNCKLYVGLFCLALSLKRISYAVCVTTVRRVTANTATMHKVPTFVTDYSKLF